MKQTHIILQTNLPKNYTLNHIKDFVNFETDSGIRASALNKLDFQGLEPMIRKLIISSFDSRENALLFINKELNKALNNLFVDKFEDLTILISNSANPSIESVEKIEVKKYRLDVSIRNDEYYFDHLFSYDIWWCGEYDSGDILNVLFEKRPQYKDDLFFVSIREIY